MKKDHILSNQEYIRSARIWQADQMGRMWILLIAFFATLLFTPVSSALTVTQERILGQGNLDGMEISQDGNFLVTYGHGNLAVWDVSVPDSAYRVNSLQLSEGDTITSADIALVYSQSQYVVALGNSGGRVKLWYWQNLASTDIQTMNSSHTGTVGRVRFSPSGSTVSSSGGDNSVKVWDVASKNVLTNLLHRNPVTDHRFSADGASLLTSSANSIFLWNVSTGKLVREFKVSSRELNYYSFEAASFLRRNGVDLVVGKGRSVLYIFNQATGAIVAKNTEFSLRYDSGNLDVSPYGKYVVAYNKEIEPEPNYSDSYIKVWDIGEDGTIVGSRGVLFNHRSEEIASIVFAPIPESGMEDSGKLFTASGEGIRHVDIVTGQNLSFASSTTGYYVGHALENRTVDIHTTSAGDTWVLTGSLDYTAKVWNFNTGDEPRSLDHTYGVRSAVWSPDGSKIASGSSNFFVPTKEITVWDSATGNILSRFSVDALTKELEAIAWTPDGLYIAVGGWYGPITFWDAQTGVKAKTFTEPVQSGSKGKGGTSSTGSSGVMGLAFSPDGRYLLAGGINDELMRVYSVETGMLVRTLPSSGYCMAFSLDGAYLASGVGSSVKIWSWSDGNAALLREFPQAASVTSIDIMQKSDASYSLGVSNWAGDIILYDALSGEMKAAWKSHITGTSDLRFTPGGNGLVSVGMDGTAKFWTISAIP